jgi:hypothetical protein
MRDLTANYAALAGILFFVGRLQVFPSLADAFLAGLLASGTVAVALVALDTVLHRAPEAPAQSVTPEPLPPQRPEA